MNITSRVVAAVTTVVAIAGCGPMDPPPSRSQPAGAPPVASPTAATDHGVPAAPLATAGPASAPAPSGPPVPAAMQPLLDAHNAARAKHCAPPLTWSPKLAAAAQAWADQLAAGCTFEHSPNNRYGENLAGGSPGLLDGRAVTAMWYDEVAKYAFPDGGFSMATGHFTQVVWRETTQIGCAVASCRMALWVCEYDPPGNVQGGYRANVLPTSCR